MNKKSVRNLLDTIETLIGHDAVFEGNIKTDKTIRIDGKIKGNVDALGILVGADAEISGNIKTSILLTGGVIRGNIVASESVELLQKAKVWGDIKTNVLTISEGAYFEGKSSMIMPDENNGEEY